MGSVLSRYVFVPFFHWARLFGWAPWFVWLFYAKPLQTLVGLCKLEKGKETTACHFLIHQIN